MVEPLKQRDDNEEANKRSLVKPKQPTKTNKQTKILVFKGKGTPYLLFCWSLESKLDCIVEPLRQRDDDEEMSEISLVIT